MFAQRSFFFYNAAFTQCRQVWVDRFMPETSKKLIVGNWKMNGQLATAKELLTSVGQYLQTHPASCDIAVCPPFTLLAPLLPFCQQYHIALGAQDCHYEESGAHTGDVSAMMLKEAGCQYVILGHSERRTDHNENCPIIRQKVATAVKSGLNTILCIGETCDEYNAGSTLEVIERQLRDSLPSHISPTQVTIAYEPVWAIGTGKTPTMEEIAKTHQFIYKTTFKAFEKSFRILYGGSAKPHNAKEILAISHVDGLLVGGASLNAADFSSIIEAASACTFA